MIETIILAGQYFFGAVALHVFICRVSPSRFMFKGLGLGFLTVLFSLFMQLKAGGIDIVSIYLLGTGWLAYLMFFINLLNSVTLKLLAELGRSPRGILLNSDFDHFFSEENGIQSRISSMIENKFLRPSENGLILTPLSLFMVTCVNILRRVFSMNI